MDTDNYISAWEDVLSGKMFFYEKVKTDTNP